MFRTRSAPSTHLLDERRSYEYTLVGEGPLAESPKRLPEQKPVAEPVERVESDAGTRTEPLHTPETSQKLMCLGTSTGPDMGRKIRRRRKGKN